MDKKSSPAFTMSSRLKQTISKFSPGPMAYKQNLDLIKHSNPSAVIGKASRQTFKPAQGPAPGQYQIKASIRPKSSSAVFPTYKDPEVKQMQRKLGPGCYDPNYDKVLRKSLSSCKFNKSPKSASKKQISKVPGPMTYDPKLQTVHIHEPVTTFGHSSRVDQTKEKSKIPGPGKYHTEAINTSRSEASFKFPQQKRESKKKAIQKLPGPLDYKIQSEFQSNLKHKKGWKISSDKKQYHSTINLPGPTSYNSQIKISWKRSPAFSISHTQRKNIFNKNVQTPGPNSYTIVPLPKKRSGSALITSSRRQTQIQLERKKVIPGPGQYEKAFEYKTIGSGIKFTIPRSKFQSLKQKVSQKRPGPWSYNPTEALKQSLKFGILGKSERQSQLKKTLPGPGDYDIKDDSKKGIKIGSEKRSKQKVQTIPGPNAYKIPSTIGNTPYYQKKKSP